VHTRSRVARTPVVPPAQSSGRQSPSHRLPASAHKDRTWPAMKQFLRRVRSRVPSALCHLRASCRLGPMSPRRFVIVDDCNFVALQVAVLSGLPTSATSFFSQCPISRPGPLVAARRRRPRHIPLARDDIPNISHLRRSTTPPGADVIPNFVSEVV
jgi:hypothetical protein